jgi:hypothetical protein
LPALVDLYPFNLAFAAMTIKSVFPAGLLLMLGACAVLPERPSVPATQPVQARQSTPDASALLNELARVASLSPEQRRRELDRLDNERRLDDARRFQLIALLEREDNVEALERSLKALNALTEGDARMQALVEIMKRALRTRIELRQQTARNLELQDKLEQIKALEKSLQQRNESSRTP